MDPISGDHMQNVERMWGSVRWGNKKCRETKRNFLDSYLSEFMWQSKLNGRNPLKKFLKYIAEFWLPAEFFIFFIRIANYLFILYYHFFLYIFILII